MKEIINNLEEYLIAALFILLLIIMIFQVTTRYGLGFTVAWLEQLARLVFVWLSFVGISCAAKKAQHIRMEAVASLIKGKTGKILMLIGEIICTIMALYLTVKIAGLTMIVYNKEQYFSAMPFMPIWVLYLSGFLGMLGLSVRTFQFGVIPSILGLKNTGNDEPA